ncbi:MAG: pyruvate, phosphate dikinase [Armatimonadia bacterium]
MAKYKPVYMFSDDTTELEKELKHEGEALKNLLGGKGANLNIMTRAKLPVPQGFTVTTEMCNEFTRLGGKYPAGLKDAILACMRKLEAETGKEFGNPQNPLLVSVRSGARSSMPGMMDTVLNLGMNDEVADGMIAITGNERFVWDAYRRLIMMFGNVVMGVKRELFEGCFTEVKKEEGVTEDTEVSVEGLKKVVAMEKKVYSKEVGKPFPHKSEEQLMEGVRAVFESWENDRAIAYRNMNKIPHDWGTAVNVQTMVFGNMGEDSGTGVAFTRDPATGEKVLYGEYLQNAQGEDVVAGIRTPVPIAELEKIDKKCYDQFVDICARLEAFYKDVQDMEFTIEKGKLFMLQTRNGKRTAQAALKIAVDLHDEERITEDEAVMLVPPDQLDQVLHPQFDPASRKKHPVIAEGVDASPGAAAGKVVFHASDAEKWAEQGERVILVRTETSPEDIRGMKAARGILTSFGGKTSHAAVVGRQMGTPCVVGCGEIEIDEKKKQFVARGTTVVKEGDWISIDGGDGEVMSGEVRLGESVIIRGLRGDKKSQKDPMYVYFTRLMSWADNARTMGVRANADTPEDSTLAIALGAEGIGLTRTEHMFFNEERILSFRKMILGETAEQRETVALKELLPHQRKDFTGILKAMDGMPVIIRLLDPPLHEFLPREKEAVAEVAAAIGKTPKQVVEMTEALHESNPMLGHRGCRLGVTFPEIYEMQVRAIFEAACDLKKKGLNPKPEVMIPLVSLQGELEICFEYTERIAKEVMAKKGVEVEYMIGTMIELPRAALIADEIAQKAKFFSFGTNDLTQTTFGFSRDDVEGKFFGDYIEKRIFQVSPFETLDQQGVGKLVKMAVELGRGTNPKLELGICGEHGGDPASVEFCHRVGLNYVSCSPLRVPIARLASAQAAIKDKDDKNTVGE